jgi:hypothetical protein
MLRGLRIFINRAGRESPGKSEVENKTVALLDSRFRRAGSLRMDFTVVRT